MSEKIELSNLGIKTLSQHFSVDQHFQSIALPRLKLILAVKHELNCFDKLNWTINYSPTNRAENCVTISLLDDRKKFHFFYSIPLSLRLNVRLFLGDNTFNFFEAYPLLIDKKVIYEGEFIVNVTMNTLPHLKLSSRNDQFERALLSTSDFHSNEVQQCSLHRILHHAFERFNLPLFQIINGTHQL